MASCFSNPHNPHVHNVCIYLLIVQDGQRKSLPDKDRICVWKRDVKIHSSTWSAWVGWLHWILVTNLINVSIHQSLLCMFVRLRQTHKILPISKCVRVVCKWVLIDAFSAFVCLMEKHFSLNCHSQICAHVCMEQEEERKTGAGHYNTVWKQKREVVKGERRERASAQEVQRNRPLQQLACHLKSFPSKPFDIEMKQCVSAGGCWEISLTIQWVTHTLTLHHLLRACFPLSPKSAVSFELI